MRAAGLQARGQALVLGALLLLALSLAVLTTVNLGHALHERIRLQNTSDAAAYSMAVAEARAFNTYAFSNRAQVSHYVSAMLFQSELSFLYFTEAFLTDVYGVVRTLDPCGGSKNPFWQAACPLVEATPGLGPLLSFVSESATLLRGVVYAYQQSLEASQVDRLVGGTAIPGLLALNSALAAVSSALMQSTLQEVLETSELVLEENDPNLDRGKVRQEVGALSACMFDRAHQRAANGSPLAPNSAPFAPLSPSAKQDSEPVARAKRALAQMANATRFPCDRDSGPCVEGFVTDRRLGALSPLTQWPWLAPLKGWLDGLPKWGQTRLLTFGQARGWDQAGKELASENVHQRGNGIRDWKDTPDASNGQLAQGDNLGADDVYSLSLGGSSLRVFGALVKNPLSCSEDDDWKTCWGDNRHSGPAGSRTFLESKDQRPLRDMMKTSVWALNDEEPFDAQAPHGVGGPRYRRGEGGIHWRVAFLRYPSGAGWEAPQGPEAEVGLNLVKKRLLPGVFVDVYVANVRPIQDGNHPWPGVAPFPNFEPGQYSEACHPGGDNSGPANVSGGKAHAARRQDFDFNQPSTWVMLNKGSEALRNPRADVTGVTRNGPALLNSQGRLTFALSGPGVSLDLNPGDRLPPGWPFEKGLNALSRGQVYYHRPGNWREPPNFFNPYWRPRLASVWQGRKTFPWLERLLEKLAVPLGPHSEEWVTH